MASLGGIWAAKPKDIHAQLVGEFPEITVQVGLVGRHMVCLGLFRQPFVRTNDCAARRLPWAPAATPGCTPTPLPLQSTKWHLYAQRRAEERVRQRQEATTTP